MDNSMFLLLWIIGPVAGMILTAGIFYWIFGIGKSRKLAERQYYMTRAIARAQGVSEDSIRTIDGWE